MPVRGRVRTGGVCNPVELTRRHVAVGLRSFPPMGWPAPPGWKPAGIAWSVGRVAGAGTYAEAYGRYSVYSALWWHLSGGPDPGLAAGVHPVGSAPRAPPVRRPAQSPRRVAVVLDHGDRRVLRPPALSGGRCSPANPSPPPGIGQCRCAPRWDARSLTHPRRWPEARTAATSRSVRASGAADALTSGVRGEDVGPVRFPPGLWPVQPRLAHRYHY